MKEISDQDLLSVYINDNQVRTPIVIVDGERRFQYMVSDSGYRPMTVDNRYGLLDIEQTQDEIGRNTAIFSTSLNQLVKKDNTWKQMQFSEYTEEYVMQPPLLLAMYSDGSNEYPIYFETQDGDIERLYYVNSRNIELPKRTHTRTIRIDIPDYNPSVYSNVEYIVDVSTRIGREKIVLACERFDFDSVVALAEPYNVGYKRYNQSFSFDILDPWDILYSDDYSGFRNAICKEIPDTNNSGALIDISISVVDKETNEYIPNLQYSSGRNLMLISNRDSDYMSLLLNDSPDGWLARLEFNEAYDGDFTSYLEETYLLDDIGQILVEIVLMDNYSIYKMSSVDFSECTSNTFLFDMSNQLLRFDGWGEYHDGMFSMASVRVFSTEGNEILDIRSNKLPLTKKKFAFLVGQETTIDDMDITIENLDIVNKIQKNIVKMNRPDDYKSNVIRPVFYKSYPLEEIELHNDVTFTISIDLDIYKKKSDQFFLQVEGKVIQESGRVPGGVLFKIVGQELPNESDSGRYYILDANQELVTEGNYRYV